MRADVLAWLSGWGTLLVFVALPLVTIATERSSKRAGRLVFATPLVILLFLLSVSDLLWLFFDISIRPWDWLLMALSLGAAIWFFRTLVQRVRDAGYPKGIAYLSCIPVASLLFFLDLLFPASKADVRAIRAFE